MMRRTPLRAKPPSGVRERPPAASCRRCRLSEPAVRFLGLRRGVCLSCQPIEIERKVTKPRRPRPTRDDPKHLAFVRTQPCLCRGQGCRGSVVPAHVRTAANSGTGIKPHDRETVPLCDGHHAEQHAGVKTFSLKYGLNLSDEAARVSALNP